MKKILAMLVAATMILGMVNIFAVAETTATGSVYYLNFKPEQAEQWEALAKVLHRADRRARDGCDRRLRHL